MTNTDYTTTTRYYCYHPVSCTACSHLGTACGAHVTQTGGHENCTGSGHVALRDEQDFAALPKGSLLERVADGTADFRYVKVGTDRWLLIDGYPWPTIYSDGQMAYTVQGTTYARMTYEQLA